jgi:glutaminyl-peptide cyclotransferase
MQVPFHTKGGEGWGLTYNSNKKLFIASDGTSTITYLTVPTSYKDTSEPNPDNNMKHLQVTMNGEPVHHINELQYVSHNREGEGGSNDVVEELWANVWYKDLILRINPYDGKVISTINMESLWPLAERPKSADCLNGIAYLKDENSFLLTGKLWNMYYKIKIRENENNNDNANANAKRDLMVNVDA